VRGMLRLDQTANGTLYGKTGSHQIAGKDVLGWFVGYVVRPGKVYVFASNIQAADRAYGKKARQLTESILRAVSIL